VPDTDPEILETYGAEIAAVTRRADSFDVWMQVAHVTDVAEFVKQRDEARDENAKLREALADAAESIRRRGTRTWLGLTQPHELERLDRWDALLK